MSALITHPELRRLLAYSPETGLFHWRVRRCGVVRGATAGGVDARMGYVRINTGGRLYLAHRLAWFYVHGEWPKAEIDHRDRDRANNRLDNLREATRSENQRNKPVYRNSRTGVKGVYWHKQHRKFVATIQVNRRAIHVGLFRTVDEAADARRSAAEHHHGQFAA